MFLLITGRGVWVGCEGWYSNGKSALLLQWWVLGWGQQDSAGIYMQKFLVSCHGVKPTKWNLVSVHFCSFHEADERCCMNRPSHSRMCSCGLIPKFRSIAQNVFSPYAAWVAILETENCHSRTNFIQFTIILTAFFVQSHGNSTQRSWLAPKFTRSQQNEFK